jgi:hypothetical protein
MAGRFRRHTVTVRWVFSTGVCCRVRRIYFLRRSLGDSDSVTGLCMPSRTCAVLLFTLLAPAFAQQGLIPLQPVEVPAGPAPDTSQGMIRLDVVVTDPSGKPVSGLADKDFTLLDNGQPQKIVSFQAFDRMGDKPGPGGEGTLHADRSHTVEPDPLVEVILVIDELNMQVQRRPGYFQRQPGFFQAPEVSVPPQDLSRDEIAAAEREAESFLRQNQGHLPQPVSIYRLTEDGLSASARSSTDGNLLADEIAHQKEPRWIWKSPEVAKSISKFNLSRGPRTLKPLHSLLALGSIAIEQRRRPGRKLMLWIGPGWQFENNESKGPGTFDFLTEVCTRLREARIALWSATEWLFYDSDGKPLPVSHLTYKDYLDAVTPEKVDFGYLTLQALAKQSGGGWLETSSNLAGLLGKHVEEANSFYSLTFDPPRTNVVDEHHVLKVEVSQANLAAHTSESYFDEPVFYDQPRDGIEHVTVEQLEHALSDAHGRPDAATAQQLSNMELTERLNSAKLVTLEAALGGKKAREALVALADASVFLAPPAAEIPATAPPDMATQRMMFARTIAYVVKKIPTLPDFFATRTINQYHERPPEPGQTWKTAMGDRSLHPGDSSKAAVHFRNGREVIEGEVTKENRQKREERTMLDTVGTFGPILAAVLKGATTPGSSLTWSRWEQGIRGPQAVFRYRVPQGTPLFVVGSKYLRYDDTVIPFATQARFHGEIAVDPATGEILRLTMQADFEPRLPLKRSDIMVEYSPVEMAGKIYICPTRAVSIARSRRIMDIQEWAESFKVYAPFETILSDMVYTKYHKFNSTFRILPGYTREDK